MSAARPHRISILAFDGVVAGDLTTPCEIFERVKSANAAAYQVRVCAATSSVTTQAFDLRVRHSLDEVRGADTLIVPGLANVQDMVEPAVLDAIREAHARGTRIASICTGAFILAASGILDGLQATTHWKAANLLAERYPAIRVDPNVLFVDNGQVLTSAGASAGIDLCLHMIKRDHGHCAGSVALEKPGDRRKGSCQRCAGNAGARKRTNRIRPPRRRAQWASRWFPAGIERVLHGPGSSIALD